MNRRDFIKVASGGALLLGNTSVSHAAAENRPPIPAHSACCMTPLCVSAAGVCDQMSGYQFPRRNPEGAQTWSNNDKLSPYTNNIIRVDERYRRTQRSGKDGYAYIKKQCMHCVDPNCVSVCPVGALKSIRSPALCIMTKISAPAAATAWSVARMMCRNTITTTRSV